MRVVKTNANYRRRNYLDLPTPIARVFFTTLSQNMTLQITSITNKIPFIHSYQNVQKITHQTR